MAAMPCRCVEDPAAPREPVADLGMDERYGEVSLLRCAACGRHWLRYHYEQEAFTRSGRWYLGEVPAETLPSLTAEGARRFFESLDGYFYGGSFFDGRSGRTAGPLV